jgi:hypothetical protein
MKRNVDYCIFVPDENIIAGMYMISEEGERTLTPRYIADGCESNYDCGEGVQDK